MALIAFSAKQPAMLSLQWDGCAVLGLELGLAAKLTACCPGAAVCIRSLLCVALLEVKQEFYLAPSGECWTVSESAFITNKCVWLGLCFLANDCLLSMGLGQGKDFLELVLVCPEK